VTARYNYWKHLAMSVLFSKYSDEVQIALATAYTGYFDASGHPAQQKAITVAGFASTVKKWNRFDVEWTKILRSEGIDLFRMTDFVNNSGDFAIGWKGETQKRKDFIARLMKCLENNVNKAFRATLVIADYNKANKLYELKEFVGRPYALCCMVCTFTLRKWAKKKNAERRLLYYFEDGDFDKGNFEQMHKAAYGVRPQFLDKSRAIAFQSADFAAWKIRNSIESALRDDHTIEKGVRLLQSVEMLSRIPKDAGALNYESLLQYCAAWKVPKRQSK